MRRIDSIQVPGETRKMLRDRLVRFLPVNTVAKANPNPTVRPPLPDQEVVELYQHLVFVPGDDVARGRSVYQEAYRTQVASHKPLSPQVASSTDAEPKQSTESSPVRTSDEPMLATVTGDAPNAHESDSITHSARTTSDSESAPVSVSVRTIAVSPSLEGLYSASTFDDLVEQGWIRIAWDHFHIPHDILMAVLRTQESCTAFKRLTEESGKDQFHLLNDFEPSRELQSIAAGVVAGEYRPGEIASVSRPWIAARLWDTVSAEATAISGQTSTERLGCWIERWELLNGPSFAISTQLDTGSFEEFIDAAMRVLESSATTPGWDEFRNAAVIPTTLLYPHRADAVESVASAIPETTIDRICWMASGAPERTFYDYLSGKGSSLMTVLLNELQDACWDTRRFAPRLMDLVVERPVLLAQLVQRARTAPALLADMLMAPSTCPLACSLIASWEFNDGGWNRAFQVHANHTTELLAFEDAVALLGSHLDAGLIPAEELAALYLHVHELASNPRQSPRRLSLLAPLRQELARGPSSLQDSVVHALVTSATKAAGPLGGFCAALDLATESGCADRIEPSALVSFYLDVLLPRGERLNSRQIDMNSAQSLGVMVLRCDENLRNRFLNATDVLGWIALASTPPEERQTFRDLMARRVRFHLRVLSRAIAGWPVEAPGELVDALASAVRAGATDNLERGRVDAFVPGLGFGHAWAEEETIAVDLAAALRRLTGMSLQKLLTQLCQVDEPIVLAGLVSSTPEAINAQLRAHLSTLTPETSPSVWNYPALQARVEALLNAGLVDVAQPFIAAERSAVTFGPVPGRELAVLRANLRVLLLRNDWAAIDSFELPDNVNESIRRDAADVLLFYRGVAELQKIGGSPAAAEGIFSQLSQRHRGIATYQLNLFASRVHRLLGGDAFCLLSGEALTQAKSYLAEAERQIRPSILHSDSDLKALDSNRAMLLLAAGQPNESLQVSLQLRERNFDAHIEGFRALAMARLGSKREALAVLTQTERVFGRTEFLSAIRANIDTHSSYITAPSLALSDDPVPGIRQAFDAFARLGHVEQAEVLQSQGRLDLYLLEEVRGACGSLVALAPMMKALGMLRLEDDISGVLKQILRSRLLLVQWAVEDQPRGGFSKSGGVGERDFVISKGAATLAVLEALVVDSVETGNLTSHFTKLLGYDTCQFFFHVTYARRSNCAGILRHLKTACTAPPNGINYVQSEDLPDFDSMPLGFKAYYEIDSRRIVVVFLALDMGQVVQREAAQSQ